MYIKKNAKLKEKTQDKDSKLKEKTQNSRKKLNFSAYSYVGHEENVWPICKLGVLRKWFLGRALRTKRMTTCEKA